MRNAAGIPQGGMKFKKTPLGGGGFTTNVQIASDGALVAGGDTYGAWVKPAGATKWQPLYTTSRLPSGEYGPSMPDTASGGFSDGYPGCYAIGIAPSNSSVIYMTWNAYIFKSTNGGTTFTKLAGGPYKMLTNTGTPRILQRKIAIDPQNPSAFLLGTMEGKVLYSTDGSTVTTLTVAAGTAISGTAAPHFVACDPSSSVVGGIKQKWVYTVEGTGIYQSTTGPGGTYTLLTGSPLNPRSVTFDASGNLWALNGGESTGGNIYKKTPAGTMAKVSYPNATEFGIIACDPANANSIVLLNGNGGRPSRSTDGGANWISEWGSGTMGWFPTAIPWFTATGNPDLTTISLSASDLVFHPTNGQVYCATGVGIMRAIPQTIVDAAHRWQWLEDSNGIELLEGAYVLSPPGGKPVYAVHDFGFFYLANDNSFVGNHNAIPGGATFNAGWHMDYAPEDPTFIAGLCAFFGPSDGYSTNGGRTWTRFGSDHPAGGVFGGSIAVVSKTDWYWFPSDNARAAETHDGGATWAYISFGALGIPTTGESGWGYSHWNPHHISAADKLTGDVYAFNYGPASNTALMGVYKRSASTGLWTKVCGQIGTVLTSAVGRLHWVSGQSGHFLFKGDGNSGLYRSTNGCVTWTQVPNVTNVSAVTTGKAASGQTYPAVYFYGQLSGTWGLFRCDDGSFANWKNLGQYIGGEADQAITSMSGHPDIYGRVDFACGHQGGWIGEYDSKLTLS